MRRVSMGCIAVVMVGMRIGSRVLLMTGRVSGMGVFVMWVVFVQPPTQQPSHHGVTPYARGVHILC